MPPAPSSFSPPTTTSSQFSEDFYPPDTPHSITMNDSGPSSRATSSSFHLSLGSARRQSDAAESLGKNSSKDTGRKVEATIRRPEDVFKVVKDRLFCWSYMVQWYQG